MTSSIRRNDAAFLDMMGARAIPDPTTAGDFCPSLRRRRGLAADGAHQRGAARRVAAQQP